MNMTTYKTKDKEYICNTWTWCVCLYDIATGKSRKWLCNYVFCNM